MKLEKTIATTLTLLLTVGTVLAATNLGSYPDFLFTDHNLNAYVVVGTGVAGAPASVEDVVGAVDLAIRLAAESYTTTTCEGAAVTAITGLDRDGINICTSATPSSNCPLTAGGSVYSNAFPSTTIKTAHYSGLKDGTFSWKNNDYDYREQVDVSNVYMSHDYGTTYVNGTEKMVVPSGSVIYEYVFEKALNLTQATTSANTGTCYGGSGTCEYTYPVKIKLLGTDFTIVGVGTNGIRALTGSSGTADASTPVTYGDYSVYAVQGSDGSWAKLVVKDKDGNTVDTLVISQGDSKDSTAAGLTLKVTAVRALQDGTVAGVDLVVGPTGTVEKDYDTSADVTSTGTANDRFPGTTDWGIQTYGFSTTGYIPAGAKIQVVYKPGVTKYLIAGEKISLPNDYGELGFLGFGTDKFATITVKPIAGVAVYNYSSDTQSFGTMNGLEISTDVASSVLSIPGNTYNKAYVLFNASLGNSDPTANWPIMIGFYDNAKQKILVNGSFETLTSGETATAEYRSVKMNGSASLRYDFKLSYSGAGERTFYLTVNVTPSGTLFERVRAGTAANTGTLIMGFHNKTAWTTSQAPEFRLGDTTASSETNDVNGTTTGTAYGIGKSSQDVVEDSGFIVKTPESNAGSDQVVFKVPNKELTVRAYFGKFGGTTPTGECKTPVPVTAPVAKLDTEIEDIATVTKNIVLVGDAAVNKWSAKAMNLSYPTYGASGLYPYSEGEGYIEVWDGVFRSGQTVVMVAGWDAADTRRACHVLQLYKDFADELSGKTAVKVTGTFEEPVVVGV